MRSEASTLGLILAGGLARRMGGGDKAMKSIGGVSILDRVIARMRPQCRALLLNANGDPTRFAATGLPVVADDVPDFAGPLAGILAGLDWAAAQAPDIETIASVPGDCPFLPRDLQCEISDDLRGADDVGRLRDGAARRERQPQVLDERHLFFRGGVLFAIHRCVDLKIYSESGRQNVCPTTLYYTPLTALYARY